jgi:glycogen phosphorylase
MSVTRFDTESIKQSIIGKLQRYNGRTLADATPQQIYYALASTVRDQIMQKWVDYREKDKSYRGKRLYYLSVEFLTGRSLYCNALNVASLDEYTKAMEELGLDIRAILREEPEPGLGNGGLGRLAACFMDSLATLNMPAMGCTIRYEFGLFRQRIIDGQQVEMPDNWLENGNVWEVAVPEDMCEVRYGGRVAERTENGRMVYELTDYRTVQAVPYDMPVAGYACDTVNTLRMWRARAKSGMDFRAFASGDYSKAIQEAELAAVISKVLYPEDNHYEGRALRLKQHYFFTSATLQHAVRDFKSRFGCDFSLLPEKIIIHINDTHPGLAIPELMRILIDEEGLGWDEAQVITQKTVAYTNHTVMQEALERWPQNMVREQLPRVFMILEELNRRLCERLWNAFPGEWDCIAHMAILAYDQVQMANLCVALSFSVNGVSKLHGKILKEDTFRNYYALEPGKFSSITNGITHRRWLMACNPGLRGLITEAIGPEWITDTSRLQDLLPFRDDPAFRDRFAAIKRANKVNFSNLLSARQGMTVDPDFIMDVQAKRLHEYKRQMLNALHILVLYNRITDDPSFTMTPRVFVFGAKASPGYAKAKLIIRFVLALSRLIDKSPRVRSMLRVVFLENYDVSGAEALIPAADVSEQLSTAGKEASGTGNMKFMMNGAVTVGTLDGANVEIFEQVGQENIFLFGLTADAVAALYSQGDYMPMHIYETNDEIRRAMIQLIDGKLFPENPATLHPLYHDLLFSGYGNMADPYLVLRDFGSYSMAQRRVDLAYADREKWLRMAIANTACSGIFSSDRTIREYNNTIWHLK